MIITKQKDFEGLLRNLGNGPIFLIGCSECATLCRTGGKDELILIKKMLEDRKIPVLGFIVLDPACHTQNNRRMLKEYGKELDASKKILVLSCGNGVQAVAGLYPEKEVLSGTDTLFLGEITHANEFNKRCNLCGECVLDLFGGLCPLSLCPKSMLNGPCGGSSQGKCEIDPHLDCVWDRIYQGLKKKGTIHNLAGIQKPKDWSKSREMKRRV